MTPIVLPEGFTREELLSTLDRELRLRARAYPRWVQLGRMSVKKMQDEIAGMKAVRAVISQLPTAPPVQPELFAAGRR